MASLSGDRTPPACNMRGIILAKRGDAVGALAEFAAAAGGSPQWAAPWVNLGRMHLAGGDGLAASEFLAYASRIDPKPETLDLLAQAPFTLPSLAVLTQYRPSPLNLTEYGRHLLHGRRYAAATRVLRRAVACSEPDPLAFHTLGIVYFHLQQSREAIAVLRAGSERFPDHGPINSALGTLLMHTGEYTEARTRLKRTSGLHAALFQTAAHHEVPSGIFSQQYDPYTPGTEIAANHRAWGARFPPAPPRSKRQRPPDQPLRVGLVSADFGQHPVGFFFDGFLSHLDPKQVALVAYCGREPDSSDTITQRLQAAPAMSAWRRADDLILDDALYRQILDDRIDVLVDCAGHTAGTRLPGVFARRAAAVQVTWGGYVGTTGLPAMDWLLSDPRQSPPEDDALTVERIWRLPDDYICWRGPDYIPDIDPVMPMGPITFGSFNNLLKVNHEVLLVWRKILEALPNSRLLLKTKTLSDTAMRQRVLGTLGAAVAPRVILEGSSRRPDLLRTYNRVDICLDPFPYSGGATTLEALWMGVPTITLGGGDRFCARHTVAHQYHVGLSALTALDVDHYAALAVGLAEDVPYRQHLRHSLRGIMLRSPLCDGPRFAQNWTSALYRMHEEAL